MDDLFRAVTKQLERQRDSEEAQRLWRAIWSVMGQGGSTAVADYLERLVHQLEGPTTDEQPELLNAALEATEP
jgi:hypothetical protein